MLANQIKIQIPQNQLIYKYNKKYDILDIYIVNNKPMISDEILNGVYEHFDRDTDELVGISIENYKNRNECELYNVLPFKLDFDYIENNIIKNFKN